MVSKKIKNDKYYTSTELAKYCVDKTKEIIGEENIIEWIEPSGGNGVFLDYLPKSTYSCDIEPEDDLNRIDIKNYLELKLEYKEGRCIIGNPPFGKNLNLARKFYKKSIQLGNYISFILPISQLNNNNSLYEFDIIYSEDLGKKLYSNIKLHCCLNIYKKSFNNTLNSKPKNKIKDIDIIRQDSKKYNIIKKYDIRMCYWGNGSAGKILKENESYSAEYKIIINNELYKDKIIKLLNIVNWKDELNCIAMLKIQQFHIIKYLKEKIPELR